MVIEKNKMQIINYNKNYSKQIPELFTNSIHKTCNKDYTKEQLNAWAKLDIDYEAWEKRLDKTKPYLAIDGKKLVGFAEFYEDYIDCFYVHHEYQGKGVGKALLLYIFKKARQNEMKKLRVDASITAKSFFEKYGFKVVKKNIIKRDNQLLINYLMTFN
ncbi:GNAT family acetyltransferase [Malaciobacter marinus]|jgi:putative acetyltransferase|uniref:GNAT family acetyltransferase n=2 Tax=Malaciobacter marinus TaxID=505249 RepID=A0AB36ZYH3_9BACT|nr:GNAT family acetyltransferase [Malaciobacter marinus]SKB57540.1 Acetyltransferase, GNAT family [Malaciobacter marinus]